MKNTIKIVGIIAIIAIIGFIVVACSGASSASDFKYEPTDDGQGVRITGYTGKGGKVVIPSTIEGLPVTEIGWMALRGQSKNEYFPANNISELVIPKSVVILSSFSFYWIENLKKVTLPDGLKVLPSSVFGDCINLTTINLPASLEKIGGKAFMNCGELVNLTIPSSLTSIEFTVDIVDERYAFRNCKKLPIKTRQTLEKLGYSSGF